MSTYLTLVSLFTFKYHLPHYTWVAVLQITYKVRINIQGHSGVNEKRYFHLCVDKTLLRGVGQG